MNKKKKAEYLRYPATKTQKNDFDFLCFRTSNYEILAHAKVNAVFRIIRSAFILFSPEIQTKI